jgi:hypothetical protein
MSKMKPKFFLMGLALVVSLTGGAYAMEETAGKSGYAEKAKSVEVKLSVDKVNDHVNKVTLSLGKMPTAGYELRIDGIEFSRKGEAYLYYSLKEPQEGQMTAQVITEPTAVAYVESKYKVIPVEDKSAMGKLSDGPIIRGSVKKLKYVSKQEPAKNTSQNPNAPVSSSAGAAQPEPIKDGKIGGIDVEGPATASPYDKASISINDETKILKQQDGKLIAAAVEDVTEGAEVEVYYNGPVLTSYPVQAGADVIVILEKK